MRHSNLYNFESPNKAIEDFIDTGSRHIPEVDGEFRLICCIVNQSNVETNGRKIYTQDCFTTGIIEGSMNNRVKECLFNNTKKRVLINGENSSNVYLFYRFQFLKIHFLSFNLSGYITKLITSEFILNDAEVSGDEGMMVKLWMFKMILSISESVMNL